jgi:hypothetical protein
MTHPLHAQPCRALVRWPREHLLALLVTAAVAIAAVSAARTEAVVGVDDPWLDHVDGASPAVVDGPWLDHVAGLSPAAADGPWLDHVAALSPVAADGPWLDHLPAATAANAM